MTLTVHEISNSVNAAWRLALREPDAMSGFDLSERGFWNSKRNPRRRKAGLMGGFLSLNLKYLIISMGMKRSWKRPLWRG